MVRVHLVRHAQSTNNTLMENKSVSSDQFRDGRKVDCPVSDVGQRQCEALGEHLKKVSGPRTLVFSSGFNRALQTANPLARALGVKCRVKPFLHEVWGPYHDHPDGKSTVFPGFTRAEIAKQFPDYDASEVGEEGWYDVQAGKESIETARERAAVVVEWIHSSVVGRTAGEPAWHENVDDVFLVTHGYFLDLLIQQLFSAATQTAVVCHPNTGYTTFDAEPVSALPPHLATIAASKVSGRACIISIIQMAATPHLTGRADEKELLTGGYAAGRRWWANMAGEVHDGEVFGGGQEDSPSCFLYVSPRQRLLRELANKGVDVEGSGPLRVSELNQCDLMHYEAEKGMQEFAVALRDAGITSTDGSKKVVVLDVGSGFGGPARYIAANDETKSITVVAVELLNDVHTVAQELTDRCKDVKDRVVHVCSDVVAYDAEVAKKSGAPYPGDAAFAVLALLHSPQLKEALTAMHKATRAGGLLYVEDFFITPEMKDTELKLLQDRVGAPNPLTEPQWMEVLAAAGWKDVVFEDVSAEWSAFLGERCLQYEATYAERVRVVGEAEAARMRVFYSTMSALFASTHLRGCRVIARA